jgi:hypothetical protein
MYGFELIYQQPDLMIIEKKISTQGGHRYVNNGSQIVIENV